MYIYVNTYIKPVSEKDQNKALCVSFAFSRYLLILLFFLNKPNTLLTKQKAAIQNLGQNFKFNFGILDPKKIPASPMGGCSQKNSGWGHLNKLLTKANYQRDQIKTTQQSRGGNVVHSRLRPP